MFGLATEDDIRELKSWFSHQIEMRFTQLIIDTREFAKKQAELENAKPEEVQLFVVEVTLNQERIATYRDVTRVWDHMEHNGQLEIYKTDGKVILKGKDYSYSMMQQEAEETDTGLIYAVIRQLSNTVRDEIESLERRVETLELRLGNKSFGKQTGPQQTKGAKR